LSARLAIRFVDYGCEVSAICPRGHILRHVPGIGQIYDYRPIASLSSLQSAMERAKPDIVIPCDDRVVWQLHELHARRPHLRPLIESSLGRASEYPIVARRERLLETALSLGVRIPETRNVLSERDVRDWFSRGPVRSVLKIDGTWGGNGVEIVDTEAEAVLAFARLSRPNSLAAALKRSIINGDPLALWGWRKKHIAPVTIQRFIPGRPANAMVACWRGEALASAIVEVLSSQGSTGAGFVVRILRNEEIARVASVLAERLGLTGYYGLDFILDETGSAHLIEMNPRCTQLGHLALSPQGDLAGALYAKLANAPVEPAAPIGSNVVAFFPQAVQADPQSRYAEQAYLDVPKEHAALVRELLLPLPPYRQPLARLYHSLRPARSPPTVDFEPSDSTAAFRPGTRRSSTAPGPAGPETADES
jgi:hypothetical protein